MSTPTDHIIGADEVRADLAHFIERQTKAPVTTNLDLFASGLISSLFAMELIVYVEGTFGVSVQGDDLKLNNFRTIDAICALVIGLRGNRCG
jgi:methoxymalonate biosynthesis acyl carrier protein